MVDLPKSSYKKESTVRNLKTRGSVVSHMCGVLEMVSPVYRNLFVLTSSHLCFKVGLPSSVSSGKSRILSAIGQKL